MDMEEKKLTVDAAEQALPVQELPADIPAEVRQKLAEDLNDEATEDLKQDMREAEKEEANDEEAVIILFVHCTVGLLLFRIGRRRGPEAGVRSCYHPPAAQLWL